MRSTIERRRERYSAIASRLRAGIAANIGVHRAGLTRDGERVNGFAERARRAMRQVLAARQARAERGAQLLTAFSYRGVLARGFTLVRDAAGRPLRSAAAVTAGAPIEIEFADGRVGAHVDDATSTAKPAGEGVKPRPRRTGGSNQGNLF